MSTYTDLHNKVKESLNVDYHSRETNQKSLFLNPENEYWGTFHGEVDVKGASINNGVLSDVTIYKANLICSSLDGVDVTTFGKRLHTLDDYVHGEFTEKIDMEDARLQNEIDKERTARINQLNMLSSNLSIAVNGKYNAMLSAFDAEVSARIHGDEDSIRYVNLTATQLRNEILAETSARIDAVANETSSRQAEDAALHAEDAALHAEDCRLSDVDYDLSCQIIDTNLRLDAEANTRYTEDTRLDFRIDSLDNMSNERYLSAMSALAEHAELNEQQLRDLSAVIDDKVEHDKHYEIIDSEQIQHNYPYVLKDFAVNRLEISSVDGYAYHIYDDREINVGMLVCENGDYDVPLTFFGLQHNDPEVHNALNPNVDIQFNEYGKIYDQGEGSGREYKIKISNGGDFENDYFTLMRDGDIYLPVIFDGRLIGKIHSYDTTPVGGAVVKKGLLTITSLDTDIKPFKHVVWSFDVDAGITEYIEDEICVKYNGDNTFSLGFNPVKCQQLKNSVDNYLFAKVYDGGIVRNDALVKNVRVRVGTLDIIDRATDEIVETPINKYFDLSVANNYTAEVAPYVYLKCEFNDDYTSYRFTVNEETIHWKYDLKLSSDEELSGETVAHVTVGTANERIEDNAFSTLSVDFTENLVSGLLPESFKQVYILKRDKTVPEHLWKASAENADGDKIQVTYDGAAINVKMIKRVSEGVTYIKFLINTDAPAEGINRSRTPYDTNLIAISTNSYTEWTYLGNTCAVIQEERTDEADQIVLNIKKNAVNEAVFVIPDRLASKKDYSREMLLVVKFMSPDNNRMINVKFVDPSGQPVKYFYDKHPEIFVGVNKYVTIKITEVANKRFLITDWNETEIRAKIKALKQYINDTADALSTDYIERDGVLSNAIDAEADARISNDLFLSNELSTFEEKTEEEIQYLSNEVSTIIRRDSKGMKYFGDVRLADTYPVDEIGAVVKEDWTLYGLIKTNDFINVSGKELKTGFTFRATGDATRTFTVKSPDGATPLELRNNDYLVLNKDINALSCISTNDVDIWKDYDLSVANLTTNINEISLWLSSTLSTEISARISCDEALSNAISSLSDDVVVIQDTIRGGINYKGVVNVIDTDTPELGSFSLLCNNFHVSSLFFIDFGTAVSSGVDPTEYYAKPNATYTADTVLSNGFMYLVSLTEKNLSDQWFVDGIQIDDKDYIIINCRSAGVECKAIKDLTSADIDVIDALDSNVVTTQLAERLSTALSTDYVSKIDTAHAQAYNEALSDANSYTDGVSSELSTDYFAKDASVLLSAKEYADDLSNRLSIDYNEQISAVSTLLSTDLSTFRDGTVADITYISNEVSVAIRRDTKGMKFFGDVKLSDDYDIDTPTGHAKDEYSLYGLIRTNAFINVSSKELKAGFTFRAATNELNRTFVTKDPYGKSIELRNNDYIVLNREINALSDIGIDDINIWKDYDLSVNALCAFTLNQSEIISNALSIDYVSKIEIAKNDAIDVAVNQLANPYTNTVSTALSTDYVEKIEALSTALSNDIDKLSTDLSGEIDSLSTALSTDVSAFINDHYERTFETDVPITAATDYKFDLLKLVDETIPEVKYVMHVEDGTIVLKPTHIVPRLLTFNSDLPFDNGSAEIKRWTYSFDNFNSDELATAFKLNSMTLMTHKSTYTYDNVYLAFTDGESGVWNRSKNANSMAANSEPTTVTWEFDNVAIDPTKNYTFKFVDAEMNPARFSAKVIHDDSHTADWGDFVNQPYYVYVDKIVVYK